MHPHRCSQRSEYQIFGNLIDVCGLDLLDMANLKSSSDGESSRGIESAATPDCGAAVGLHPSIFARKISLKAGTWRLSGKIPKPAIPV